LPIGVNVRVNGCMSLYVPWMDWRPVQGVPCLRPMSVGIGSSAPATLMRISGIDNGWMDIHKLYILSDEKEFPTFLFVVVSDKGHL